MGGQLVDFDAAQVETLATRQNRRRHFTDFRRRKNEFDAFGRFFQRFQKRVERLLRQHMDFVDDVYFKTGGRRVVTRRFNDFAHIVNARVGRRVDFNDVDMAVFRNRPAMFANAARLGRHAAFSVRTDTVQRTGDDTRRSRFAHAANAGQDVCLSQTSGVNRIFQRPDKGFLTDQVGKGRRTVFPRQHAVFLIGIGHFFQTRGKRILCGNKIKRKPDDDPFRTVTAAFFRT